MASIKRLFITLNIVITIVSCNHNYHAKVNQGQNQDNDDIIRCDTMTKESFFVLATKIRRDMDSHKEMSLKHAIEAVKVYNTLHLAELARDENWSKFSSQFIQVFITKYLNKIVQMLECGYGKGMTIYSRKYDLYVGIGSEFRCKDIYTIVL
ncbi:MAG: hypothetical protein JNM88_12540 [Chitinophagaceae bacterium]|nr:hypothetical protein [Chitinophagaceae bacterium]